VILAEIESPSFDITYGIAFNPVWKEYIFISNGYRLRLYRFYYENSTVETIYGSINSVGCELAGTAWNENGTLAVTPCRGNRSV
jgi:hypothetical protein